MRDIEKYTKDYNVANFEDYQVKYRRKKILEILEKYKPKSILEIGCGMEPLFQFINAETYERYTVIEPSEVFYNNAVECAKSNHRVECINDFFGSDTAEKLPGFDMIICSSLLHEIEEPDLFVESFHKVCDNNTIIHINVPNAQSFHRLLAKSMGLIKDEYEKSERNILYQQREVFDIECLSKLMQTHNFSVIESGSYFLKPFTHGQMFQMMEKKIIDEAVLDGLYNMAEIIPMFGSEIFVNCKIK